MIINFFLGYSVSVSKSSRTKAVNRSMTLRRNMKESEKKLKKKAKLEDSNKFFKDDIPVWLNSFLSILVPSCFLDPMDPTLDEKYKNKLSEVNKKHQTKVSDGSVVDIGNTHSTQVMRYQIITSTTIILFCVGLMSFVINKDYRGWNYNNNIFDNLQFNIFCAVLASLGLTSFIFLNSINIYDILNVRHGRYVRIQNHKSNMILFGRDC